MQPEMYSAAVDTNEKDNLQCICRCTCRVQEDNAAHHVRPILAVAATLFVFSCVMLGCNIWILKENIHLKTEMMQMRQEDLSMQDDTFDHHETYKVNDNAINLRDKRDLEENKEEKRRRKHRNKISKTGKGGPCKCRRGRRGKPGRKGPKGERGEMGERGFQGPKGDQGQSFSMMSAHYSHDFDKDVDIQSTYWQRTENVMCNEMWDGTVCRNRTYTHAKNNSRITFLKKTEQGNSINPFSENTDGRYKAKYSGLYLVYFHVVFYDISSAPETILIHRRDAAQRSNVDTVLRCINGTDSYLHGPKQKKNKEFKTCSITTALYLQKDESIEIQSSTAGTVIDLSKDATYFGAILLSMF